MVNSVHPEGRGNVHTQMKKNKTSTGIWIRTKSFMTCLYQVIMNILSTLNKFTNLIVAIATIALVVVTYFYIHESKDMTRQTKRLADISIEQFKIKSYPSLEVHAEIQSIDSEGISEKYDVTNAGDITAFHCTFLPIHVFLDKKETPYFMPLVATFYSGQERLTVLNYPKDIPRSVQRYLETRRNFSVLTLKELKYLLLFIRFRVPYDEKFRYETLGGT